jgi:hypothetical protein
MVLQDKALARATFVKLQAHAQECALLRGLAEKAARHFVFCLAFKTIRIWYTKARDLRVARMRLRTSIARFVRSFGLLHSVRKCAIVTIMYVDLGGCGFSSETLSQSGEISVCILGPVCWQERGKKPSRPTNRLFSAMNISYPTSKYMDTCFQRQEPLCGPCAIFPRQTLRRMRGLDKLTQIHC